MSIGSKHRIKDDFFEFILAIGEGDESEEEKIEMIKDASYEWWHLTFKIDSFSSALLREDSGRSLQVTAYKYVCPYDRIVKDCPTQFISYKLRDDLWEEFAKCYLELNGRSALVNKHRMRNGIRCIEFGKLHRERLRNATKTN